MHIAVLGAGMVGRAIALDLAPSFSVTAFDRDTQNLAELKKRNEAIHTVAADLSRFTEYPQWLAPFDMVVTAVPGFMGFRALEAVIHAGKDVVDISFFPENALELDALAIEKKVIVITDCGVAPGMSNLVLGRYNEEMKIDAFACYVGGLPANPQPPFFYKAPFSPVDVIQEYIRPARLMEGGKIITKPALSDRERIHFEEAGELEAFNTDGLRSLLYTMKHIPDMKEKTLRYPGHIDLIIALRQSGFFETTPVKVNNVPVSPLELTSAILVREWTYEPGEAEFTVMKIIIRGEGNTIEYDLFDRYDPLTQTSSMARTTGYTCTAAVHLIAKQLFTAIGVFPPELVGRNRQCFEYVLSYLEERGVKWKKTIKNG